MENCFMLMRRWARPNIDGGSLKEAVLEGSFYCSTRFDRRLEKYALSDQDLRCEVFGKQFKGTF